MDSTKTNVFFRKSRVAMFKIMGLDGYEPAFALFDLMRGAAGARDEEGVSL
jgi:hypothetical protein